MSEFYNGPADHATYEGHDPYQGEEYGAQYAEYQEQVHHAIEVIGEKIEDIQHDIQHDVQDAYAADEYKGEQYSLYARS